MIPSRITSPTAWRRKSLPRCRAANGCWLSRAIHRSPTRANPSTCVGSAAISACATCSRAASGARAIAFVSSPSSSRRPRVRTSGADRFDGDMTDVFGLQDQITEKVVATLEPKILLAEIDRLKNKPAANLDAYDLLLRAQGLE